MLLLALSTALAADSSYGTLSVSGLDQDTGAIAGGSDWYSEGECSGYRHWQADYTFGLGKATEVALIMDSWDDVSFVLLDSKGQQAACSEDGDYAAVKEDAALWANLAAGDYQLVSLTPDKQSYPAYTVTLDTFGTEPQVTEVYGTSMKTTSPSVLGVYVSEAIAKAPWYGECGHVADADPITLKVDKKRVVRVRASPASATSGMDIGMVVTGNGTFACNDELWKGHEDAVVYTELEAGTYEIYLGVDSEDYWADTIRLEVVAD